MTDGTGALGTLTEAEREAIVAWCRAAFTTTPAYDRRVHADSYYLKHRFEDCAAGFYVDNEQFKAAMLAAGFEPLRRDALNWVWKIYYTDGWKRPRRGDYYRWEGGAPA